MTYREKQYKGKFYEWYECDILGCDNIAKHQSVISGRVVCNDHFAEVAPVPWQHGFVKIDGGRKPKTGKR